EECAAGVGLMAARSGRRRPIAGILPLRHFMDNRPDMHAHARTSSHADQAPVTMVFLSPDRALAQRVITRLRELGRVTWQPSCSPGDFNHRVEPGIVLVDFSPARLDSATQWVRELTLMSPQTIVLAVGCTSTDGSAGIL